jgi:hypothetical protein
VPPLVGEAVEGNLSSVEVADREFDLKDVHTLLSFPLAPNQSCCPQGIKITRTVLLPRIPLLRTRVNKGKR